MKIGIMTFHAAPNHGAALQAWALQTYVQKMGHEPFFINFHHGVPRPTGVLGWAGRNPKNTMHKVAQKLKRKPFERFQQAYLTIGKKYYHDHIQLQNDPPAADIYICGSDQVWNPMQISMLKDENAFWLNFGSNDVRCLSYAASFGSVSLSKDVSCRYAKLAQRFNAISVREKSGVDIVKSFGIEDVSWVPDPTLLINPDEYAIVRERHLPSGPPFLFSYQIESQTNVLNLASNIRNYICSTLKLLPYEALSMSLAFNIVQRRFIGPSKWLGMLYGSDFVFTNSFHATVFSLLFHKPFLILLRTGEVAGLNDRILSLLRIVGLENRTVMEFNRKTVEDILHQTIDWEAVDDRLTKFSDTGRNFLKQNLS